jgi:1,2-phenylacetyl-CoA epoxidase catalytic subunit
MNKVCQLLNFDADVLLFNQDTYIVSRFKELISQSFIDKFNTTLDNANVTVSGTFHKLCINKGIFQSEDITWQSSSKGINCQVFKVWLYKLAIRETYNKGIYRNCFSMHTT